MKTWYAVVHGSTRGEEWVTKVKMDFPDDEDQAVIAAVLTHAGYFDKPDAEATYKTYLTTKDKTEDLFFYAELTDDHEFTPTGGRAIGEEWNMGYGLSKEEATSWYLKSEPAQETEGDW